MVRNHIKGKKFKVILEITGNYEDNKEVEGIIISQLKHYFDFGKVKSCKEIEMREEEKEFYQE